MTAGQQPRRGYIDSLKGFGILLVVTAHYAEYYRGRVPALNAGFECVYLFHMCLFCLCSGLVAKPMHPARLLRRQVWLYLVLQAFTLALRITALHDHISGVAGWASAVFLPWRQLWYLYALVFWDLTVPLLQRLRDRGRAASAGAFLGVLALGLLAGRWELPFALNRVAAFYPCFAFGVLARPVADGLAAKASRSPWRRAAAAGTLLGAYGVLFARRLSAAQPLGELLFQESSYAVGGYGPLERLCFYAIGFATSLLLVAVFSRGRCLAWLGQHTLPLYALHLQLMALLVELGVFDAPAQKSTAAILCWVSLSTVAAVALFTSAPFLRGMEQILNFWQKKVTEKLSDERKDHERNISAKSK